MRVAWHLAVRSVLRRGWGLVLLWAPAGVLFAMVTFLFATHATVVQLLNPGIAPRVFRVGTVEGIAVFDAMMFTQADANRLAAIPGARTAPAFFHDCFTDPNEPDEFDCAVTNRTYVEIWHTDIPVPEDELQRWDAVKSGAIVTRAAATKHHWNVGDHITLTYDTTTAKAGQAMDLVITYIADKYIDPSLIYLHIPYFQDRFAGIDTLRYWVIWMLVDDPARRAELMARVDAEMLHPHTTWTMEVSQQAMLTGSAVLRESFSFAGLFAIGLVTCLTLGLLIVSIEARIAELATLLALGYRRALLAMSVLLEGALLLPPAAVLGAILVWLPFHAHPIRFDLLFNVKVTLLDAFASIGSGVAIGLFAALVPAWRTYRLDVISSLR